jgi:aminoglycoside/choline kinase family phosphotransferase
MGPGWAVVESPARQDDLALATRAGFDDTTRLDWITGHGSERRFVRLRRGDRRAVLMRTPADDPDHHRFLAVAGFLYGQGLGAPAVLAHDATTRAVLLEDLGDDTLQTLVSTSTSRAPDLYDRVLDRLADLQTFGVEARGLCPLAWDRPFDHEHLRWETDYFRERFLVGHAGLVLSDLADLTPEFEALARACLAQPRTLVHRDFQSQNILIKDGVVRLVDFQGMRWGPMAYDVVSLLYDPYVDLDPELVALLLDEFPARVAARGGPVVERADWRAMTTAAALQRLMQALGAYGFLGHVKHRRIFLDFIPAARHRLEDVLRRVERVAGRPTSPPSMPRLQAVLAALPD